MSNLIIFGGNCVLRGRQEEIDGTRDSCQILWNVCLIPSLLCFPLAVINQIVSFPYSYRGNILVAAAVFHNHEYWQLAGVSNLARVLA